MLKQLMILIPIFVSICAGDTLTFQLFKKRQSEDEPLIGGDFMGAFYAQVSIGTPPQNFLLDIDTGSAYTVVVAKKCRRLERLQGCLSANPGYNPNKSSTSAEVSCDDLQVCRCGSDSMCNVQVKYGDNSGASGDLFRDVVSIGDNSAMAYFGSMTSESGAFTNSKSDGILGLAYNTLSDGIPTLMDVLVQSGKIADVFSICFGEQNGLLILGGNDPKHFTGNIVFTPIVKESYFVVNLQQITVDQATIRTKSQEGDTIVDSGTSGITLPSQLYDDIVGNLADYCNQAKNAPNSLCGIQNVLNAPPGSCIVVNDNELDAYPRIHFTFQGIDRASVSISIGGRDYLRLVQVGGVSCSTLGIYKQDGLGIILGDTFMKAFYTVFDRQNKRIGFATDVNCGSDVPQPATNDSTKDGYMAWLMIGLMFLAAGYVFYE